MKEELIRVLNYKLNDINSDIESLINLNNKIDEEKERSGFVGKILDIFKDNDVMKFADIEKGDFDRALEIGGEEIKDVFNTNSCNYDGLVYLINGINNGVSLTLTDEQESGIKRLISVLESKKKEFDSAIDGYTLVKSRYKINDVDELNSIKEKYQSLISGYENNDYIKDTELLNEAIKFSDISPEETVNLLTYVLEYNANVYKEGKPVIQEEQQEDKYETPAFEEPTYEDAYNVEVEEPVEETKEENVDNNDYDINSFDTSEFHFNQIDNNNLFDLPNVTFDENESNEEETKEESYENNEDYVEIPPVEETNEEEKIDYSNDYQEYAPFEDANKEEEISIPDDLTYSPAIDETHEEPVEESPVEDNVSLTFEENEEPTYEEVNDYVEENISEENIPEENNIETEVESHDNDIDNDFKDVVNDQTDYDESDYSKEDEKTSTRELQKIFGKYGIEENTILNELIDGNVDEYQNILDSLKDNGVLEHFRTNRELLVETLLYSNIDVVDKVLSIIKEDLSVDDEDYEITLKIAINTIPSIFIKDGGNYDNFVNNVSLFKDIGVNLINLFDFSKEVFVADHESIKKNVDVINKYGFDITYKNAKYFLLISNIADKLDYYIESVYDDKTKNETFDGTNYIKDYAAKLNVVTDETIKRLRYASENGKKVFGSKPGSLTGEITNLKVNALDISDDYLNKFFDNNFANLTGEETREYVKLIHNSSNVGNYSDELDKLNGYRDGLRYNIEGVNVSYNKVVRNYNILRSYGIDRNKALQFAVCYNLVITKDEYDKLNDLLEKIGGNA